MSREPTEMELRVARALQAEYFSQYGHVETTSSATLQPAPSHFALARAAIRTMREPTPEIISALGAVPAASGRDWPNTRAAYSAMIDAASPPE